MTLMVNRIIRIGVITYCLLIVVAWTGQATPLERTPSSSGSLALLDVEARRQLEAEEQLEDGRSRNMLFIGSASLVLVLTCAWFAEPWISRRWRYGTDGADEAYQRICDLDNWLQKLAREINLRRAWEERFTQRLYQGIHKLTSYCFRLERTEYGGRMRTLRKLIDKLKMHLDTV